MTIRRWRRGKSDFSRGADDLSGRIEVCKSMDLSLKSHMSISEYCVATFSMLGSCHIKINNDTSPISRRQYLPTSDRSVWSNFFFSQPRSLFSSCLPLLCLFFLLSPSHFRYFVCGVLVLLWTTRSLDRESLGSKHPHETGTRHIQTFCSKQHEQGALRLCGGCLVKHAWGEAKEKLLQWRGIEFTLDCWLGSLGVSSMPLRSCLIPEVFWLPAGVEGGNIAKESLFFIPGV